MPWIFGWALIASLGLLSGCVDGNGARYWRLICWLMGVVEEKSPCGSRSFGWLGSTTSSTSRLPHFTIWGAKVPTYLLGHPGTVKDRSLLRQGAQHKCLSCTRTSLFLGDAVRALIVGFSHFFFLAAVVLGPPNRTCRSAETRVSKASS